MEPHRTPWKPLIPKSSMNWFYSLIEYLPISRLSYNGPDDSIRWPPNRHSPRLILPGQLIHDSVFAEELKRTGYEPAALFRYKGHGWDEEALKKNKIVEDDPYSHAGKTLQSIKESNDNKMPVSNEDYDALTALSSTAIGQRSITEFPGSSTILATALEAEFNKSVAAGDKSFVIDLEYALNSFSTIPRQVYNSTVWSVLDKLYVNEPPKWHKFHDCFGPIREVLLNPVSAICIGIDTYHAKDMPSLRGPVADALSVSAFLTDSLGSPKNRIAILLNKMATRAAIIQRIWSLASNEQIKFNDPIVISFSGNCYMNSKTACILPYDYPDAELITADVINDLLAYVASVKGNNITLILDCCYAGSFGRDNYANANFSSHVLLAACGKSEMARERDGHGLFTSNLIRVLREVEPADGGYTCTYRNIIQRLPPLGPQTPSCEGKHDDRIVFSTKKPTGDPALDDITLAKQNTVLTDIRACRDQGNKLNISIARDDSPLSCDVVRQLVEQDSDTLRFVGRDNPHQVLVLVRNGNTVFEISDRDELTRLLMVATSDVSVIGRILEHASHFLWHLWRSPTLESIKNKAHVVRDITLEAWRLSSIDGRYTSASSPVGDNLNQDGVIKISVADAEEPSLKLGFRLTNRSRYNLFIRAFTFHTVDLSIDTVYKPAFVNGDQASGDACLPAGGHLKFSNVSTGEQLTILPPGIERSVSYLKIFISNFLVDLSFIEQVSPLHVDGLRHDYLKFPSDSSDLHDGFTTTSGTLRLRGGAQQQISSPSRIWNTIVVPIVKRREE